jgi:hypothetical protein
MIWLKNRTYDLLHALEVRMPNVAVLVLRFPPTNCYDITEILLKVVLNTNNTISIPSRIIIYKLKNIKYTYDL